MRTAALPGAPAADHDVPWHQMIEDAPVAVAVITADARFAYVNAAAAVLYGAAAHELAGTSSRAYVPPGQEAETREMFVRVLRGETLRGRRWRLLRHDGSLVAAVVNAGPVTFHGEPAVQVMLRDVSVQAAGEAALRASEERWHQLFSDSPVGIGLADDTGRWVAVNAALCGLLGRTEAELVGADAADAIHPDDHLGPADLDALIDGADDGVARVETRLHRRDDRECWAWVTVTRATGPDGRDYALTHVQDVTARRAAQQRLQESEAGLRAIGEVVRSIQAGGDARQTIVEAGAALGAAAFVSLAECTADGRMLRIGAANRPEFVGAETALDGTSLMAHVYRTGEPLLVADPVGHPMVAQALLSRADARSILAVPVRAGGSTAAVLVIAWRHRVASVDDARAAAVTLLADEAGVALRQANLVQELAALALTDPLTSLPNRRGWDRDLACCLDRARRSGRPLTVALADLDRFKAFNDTYGHPAGDALLQGFAAAGRSAVRAVDCLARWGGEEFAFALPECGPDDAHVVLDRLRASVPLGQTCSVGYAVWDGVESAAALMRRADEALYAAKSTGRDRLVLAG